MASYGAFGHGESGPGGARHGTGRCNRIISASHFK